MSSASFDFDYLVIGGGSGGVSSAKRAALLYGKKVAIVEGARWGGTCVNVGCVPKKIMFQTAQLWEQVHHDAKMYKITTSGPPVFDWKALKEKRDKYIVRLNSIYLGGLEKANIKVFEGWATFVNAHTVQIVNADATVEVVTAAHILIAVGGKPMVPAGVGVAEHCITSDGFFDLEELPRKAVVVGAGYIAVELAGVLNALGSDTHLVVRKHMALREFDPDVNTFLDGAMVNDGITIHRNTEGVAKIELSSTGKKTVTCVNGTVVTDADIVLMAPGRIPNVDGLGLEHAGVKQNDRSHYITTDDYQNTSVKHIYALGDVAGQVELTPMAIAAGRRLADRIFGNLPHAKASYENVPTVVFSHPTIGTCGLTEQAAVAKYGAANLNIYKSSFVNLYYSMFDLEPNLKPKTLMKIICAGIEEQVVGLHIVGMGADEMLQGFGVAMKMGCTKADLDACVAIHPTGAEELVTMGVWGTSPQYSGAKVPPLDGAAAPEPTISKM